MKKLKVTIIIFLMASFSFAQSPFYFNYQAVARDAQGQALKNQNVSLRMSLLENSNSGTAVFTETHQLTSSNIGVINLLIGSGQNQNGSLSGLNWKNKNYWLKVEMDASGGTNYSLMSTTQLVSVPYALQAETATHVDDADADPQNEIQSLSFNSATNELSISNSNSVTIPTGGTDADADPLNEIQIISKTGNTVSLSKNGGSFTDEVNDADSDSSNELQNLSLTGNNLSLSKGNQVDLSAFKSHWQEEGTGIKYEGKKVIIIDPANPDEIVNIHPYVVNVNDDYQYQSYHRGNTLEFQNLSITPSNKAEYGFYGLKFSKPGSQPVNYAVFDKDSLWQYDPAVGLLSASKTKMIPGHLTLDYGNLETTRLSGFGLDITSKDVRDISLDINNGLQLFEYASPNDRFTRFSLSPDSLNMYNSAKWKIAQFGKDPDFGNGMVKLYHSGGLGELAHLAGYDDGGGFLHFKVNDALRAELDASIYGSYLALFGINNSLQYLVGTDDIEGGSYMSIGDTLGSPQVQIWASRDSDSVLIWGQDPVQSKGHVYSSGDVYAPVIQSVIEDTIWSEMTNLGFVTEGEFSVNTNRALKNENYVIWEPSLTMKSGEYKDGNAIFNGTNGNSNVRIFGLDDGMTAAADYGAVYVYDNTGTPRAGIEVDPFTGDGVIWGTTKNFRVDYPTRSDKDIVYASLEGPEAAAYIRGTAKLENGRVFVKFPEHYRLIANAKTMTVILTPQYSKTFGLAVVEKTEEGFRVEELMDGKGSFSFDWEVKCVRKGQENFKVIRDKLQSRLHSNKKQIKRNTFSHKYDNNNIIYRNMIKKNHKSF